MTTDFLAICLIGAGSSYGRAPTREAAVAHCKRALEQDWGSLYDLDGKEATLSLYDATGHESVFWDHRGVHPDSAENENLPSLGTEKVTLSVRKRRRA